MLPSSYAVYILQCSDGTYYTGAAANLKRRLKQHQNGLAAKYTRGRRPVKLLYAESQPSLRSAYQREKEIQKLNRNQKEKLCCLAKSNVH